MCVTRPTAKAAGPNAIPLLVGRTGFYILLFFFPPEKIKWCFFCVEGEQHRNALTVVGGGNGTGKKRNRKEMCTLRTVPIFIRIRSRIINGFFMRRAVL